MYIVYNHVNSMLKVTLRLLSQQACVILYIYIQFPSLHSGVHSPNSCGLYMLRVLLSTLHIFQGTHLNCLVEWNAWPKVRTSYITLRRESSASWPFFATSRLEPTISGLRTRHTLDDIHCTIYTVYINNKDSFRSLYGWSNLIAKKNTKIVPVYWIWINITFKFSSFEKLYRILKK